MKRIAITGANGYIASLVQLYNGNKFEFVRVSRRDVDYTHPEQVRSYFQNLDFDLVFHTAANATTAACEGDPHGTHLVNCDSAIEIAKVCQERGKRIIFISTEQIFNGKTVPGPFAEDEEPVSVTAYGQQKAEVDAWMRANMDDYVILRFSWMFGLPLPHVKPSPGIVSNTLKALRTKTPTLFTVNEKRCMTYTQRLADQFPQVTQLPSGVYHFASQNDLCTYDCARLVARKFGASEEEIAAYILPNHDRYADRFRDFRLDNAKALAAGLELGTFEDDVDRCLADFGW